MAAIEERWQTKAARYEKQQPTAWSATLWCPIKCIHCPKYSLYMYLYTYTIRIL